MSAPDTSEDRINGAVGMCQAHGLHGSADLIKSLAAQLTTARAEAHNAAIEQALGCMIYGARFDDTVSAIRALITPPKEIE